MPPMPIAASRLIAPVGIASTRTRGESAPDGRPPPAPPPPAPRFPRPPPLRPRHRLERAAERRAAPCLHLHERHQVTPARHQVDLGVPHPEAVRRDHPALALQIAHRLLLGDEPALVALVFPRRGVAAKAAVHSAQPN